ncbi:hypothetical protein ACLQ16_03870 [Streptomyces albidoflavus]|uniref:hypothetical protein n=1 Tax=Streptomyces albidoflavus TaxID=1886 RepID=UPI000A1CE170|nr:hypothetical protein [Streptomyces albidoflavus]
MSTTTLGVPRRDEQLVALLRVPVWNALAERADTIRRALPPRPADARARYAWLCSLDEDQARRAALLDRLDALCGHIAGRPAPGYAPGDPLPAAALEEADGFTGAAVASLIAEYRAQQGVSAG